MYIRYTHCDVPRPPRVLRGTVVDRVYHHQPPAGARQRPWRGPRQRKSKHLRWEWEQVSHQHKGRQTPHGRGGKKERERQSDGRRSRPRGACTGRSPNPDWFRTGSRWSGPSEDPTLPRLLTDEGGREYVESTDERTESTATQRTPERSPTLAPRNQARTRLLSGSRRSDNENNCYLVTSNE